MLQQWWECPRPQWLTWSLCLLREQSPWWCVSLQPRAPGSKQTPRRCSVGLNQGWGFTARTCKPQRSWRCVWGSAFVSDCGVWIGEGGLKRCGERGERGRINGLSVWERLKDWGCRGVREWVGKTGCGGRTMGCWRKSTQMWDQNESALWRALWRCKLFSLLCLQFLFLFLKRE